jgi:hypothetical protein
MKPLLEAVEHNTEGIKINEKSNAPILAFAFDIVLLQKEKREAQRQWSWIT